MAMMTGGEAVVEALRINGISTVYGLPGVQSDHLFNALFDAGDAISVVHTRHEQGAGYMALGAALATGKPQAYSVVPGPGVLNASAALATAYGTSAPVLCLASQIMSSGIGKGYGLLHELPDQLAILKQLTKYAATAYEPGSVPGLMREAFTAMQSGRPRPAAIELPQDVLGRKAEVAAQTPAIAGPRPAIVAGDIDRAVDMIRHAAHPVIYSGTGATDCPDDLRLLAERIGAPVVFDLSGRGNLDARHPLAHTLAGGHRFWKACDLVIAAGARPQIPLRLWGVDDGLKYLQIDIDPDEMGRLAKTDLGLIGDTGEVLRLILDRIREPLAAARGRIEASARVKTEVARDIAVLEPQLSYLKAIRDVLPEDGILVDELTQVTHAGRIAWQSFRPRTLITPGYQGTLGWGVAAALGVKHAVGSRAVVSVAGDGGFMYTMPELATAVRHRLAVVYVVFNDNAYGNVLRMQKELYGNRVIGSDLTNPDFVKLAESFGIGAARARSPEELRPALETAIASGEPRLIEVPVGEMPAPWAFINMPRVRGQS